MTKLKINLILIENSNLMSGNFTRFEILITGKSGKILFNQKDFFDGNAMFLKPNKLVVYLENILTNNQMIRDGDNII
ncbi:hypothetical protein BpHYR1_023445 [Brachionus plicatilis]|uniref:Uncharacterized protein n=1 Tax=Brachionus plicatilis TaxID=10195 RepID=A0A3M7Q5R0_BRAPC|nr:hypothetical protein BpHYR1_023445 [Brachionus plicatilis]